MTMQEKVKEAIYTAWQSGLLPYAAAESMNSPDDEDWQDVADAAIAAVIEALAAEAEERRIEVTFNSQRPTLPDWLQAHVGGMEAAGERAQRCH